MKLEKIADKLHKLPLGIKFVSILTIIIIVTITLIILFSNVLNLVTGNNAHFKEDDYCLKNFVDKYGKEPYDYAVNFAGDCMYKFDSNQKEYVLWYKLKDENDYECVC